MSIEAAKSPARATSEGRTAVVAALPEEVRPLLRRLRSAGMTRLTGVTVHRGTLAGRELLIAETGDGAQRAATGLRALLDHQTVDRLVVIGIAAGLSAGLESASLVVAREVRDGPDALPAPDPSWIERTVTRTHATLGAVLTTDRVLCSCEAKRDAAAGLATAGAATADLESAAYVRLAVERDIPYTVLRVVSDTAEEALPLDFNAHLTASGGIDRLGVARQAVLRPALMSSLWQLRERVAVCAERLADAVERLVEETP